MTIDCGSPHQTTLFDSTSENTPNPIFKTRHLNYVFQWTDLQSFWWTAQGDHLAPNTTQGKNRFVVHGSRNANGPTTQQSWMTIGDDVGVNELYTPLAGVSSFTGNGRPLLREAQQTVDRKLLLW
ncbi:predicted protein [Verticillium alfalfae VaMs.102]|uniref:Predicted protein n=1 Tax=Verticillium alfalfae (strain VaMs.102 / ATCC MYA-4576 / FGSC 10136) TaxID=526221 RepID=C9SNC2_VERA1|nr:predicted protein [Verticillium alfalfae VaMs.102]EEY20287.1 predicted protein [Verticillium alfalfae VaMs.102]